MDEKGLGKRLQDARRAVGLTQQELCQKSGLSYSTLAKIERGAIKSPSVFTIQYIAAALGTSLDALLGLEVPSAVTKKTSRRGTRFVYFDVNGCLVQFTHHVFSQLASESGTPIDVVQGIYMEFDDAVNRGNRSVEDMNAALSQALGMDVDWLDCYLNTVQEIPGMVDLVAWAHEHYHVGLLSNSMPGFIEALQARGKIPQIQFDVIVDSSQVGMVKPERRIYEIAAEQTGVAHSEILFVDDLSTNLVAAKEFGWHTIWFDPYRPEESISSIRQALEFDA